MLTTPVWWAVLCIPTWCSLFCLPSQDPINSNCLLLLFCQIIFSIQQTPGKFCSYYLNPSNSSTKLVPLSSSKRWETTPDPWAPRNLHLGPLRGNTSETLGTSVLCWKLTLKKSISVVARERVTIYLGEWTKILEQHFQSYLDRKWVWIKTREWARGVGG